MVLVVLTSWRLSSTPRILGLHVKIVKNLVRSSGAFTASLNTSLANEKLNIESSTGYNAVVAVDKGEDKKYLGESESRRPDFDAESDNAAFNVHDNYKSMCLTLNLLKCHWLAVDPFFRYGRSLKVVKHSVRKLSLNRIIRISYPELKKAMSKDCSAFSLGSQKLCFE